MVNNPFNQYENLDILKEAFPLLDIAVIDDTLCSTKGDVNQAFELLLAMSDPTQSYGPPIPSKPSNIAFAESSPGAAKPLPNPFLTNTINAKPLTVREELAQWRQDLREESNKKRANSNNSSSRSGTSTLALSNLFKSNSSRSSLNDRNSHSSRETYHHNSHHGTIGSRADFQRPLLPTPNRLSNVSNLSHSISTPNINYQTQSRASNYVTQASSSHQPQPPPPPTRHLNNSNISTTNPFLASPQSQLSQNITAARAESRGSVPNIPSLPPRPQQHRRELNENNTPSFNPFEEVEVPPPAYNEIHRDSVVNLSP